MIPTFKQLQPQLLIVLHELGGSSSRKDAIDRLAQKLNLSDEELESKYEQTGAKTFANTCSWAREYLKRDGYIKSNSLRGVWELSSKGKEAIPQLLQGENLFLEEEPQESEKYNLDEEIDDDSSFLDYLKKLDPYKFERLCAKLFEKMNLENVKYTQSSNDKGIDGFGDLVFGLVKFRVVFQAKRFSQNAIGSPDIQKLAGAMQQNGAEKAVFITTSRFSKNAKEAASNLKIELIDGDRLIELLQENKIGFSERIIYEMNQEFFEEL